MKVNDYDYHHTEAEFKELWDLLVESYALTGRPDNWLFDRLEDWRYGGNARRARENPRFFVQSVHLWRNKAGKLVGFSICEYGDNSAYLQVHPDYRAIESAMLDWLEDVWAKDKESIEIEAYQHDTTRQALLAQRGYQDAGEVGYMRAYDLSHPYPPIVLPDGFRIETLAENHDYDSHIEAVRQAFARPVLDRAWFDSKITAPSYDMNWDLSVVSPGGTQVAFCLAWIDPQNQIAEIDPIGTHPDYQRQGFARAVVTECFRRLHAQGIRYAYIGSGPEPYVSNRLYVSLQPVETYQARSWVKQITP